MKFAVIGTNFISDNFADAIKTVGKHEITAVYSRGKETGEAFSRKHGIERSFTDYREMLSAGGFDAVYVASPTLFHAEHSMLAMESGYHVLCEKMMASGIEEFYEMESCMNKTGKVLLEAMRPSFDPAYDLIRKNLHRIGKIRRADLSFCQYSSRYDRFKSGILTNAFDPKMKNSALSDIGIYPLNIALSLFGYPQDFKCASVLLDNGFEGAGGLLLKYADKTVTVSYSKISDGHTPSVIEGELGSILIDKLTQPTELTLISKSKEKELLPLSPVENNMIYEIEAFADMCCGARSHVPYLEITEKAQRIVDVVYTLEGISDHF